jgi:predicted phage terminase large subunit-like protein
VGEVEAVSDFLNSLSDKEAIALYYDWRTWARPNQLAPPGDWTIWLLMAGRGFGKSRSGAEWVIEKARETPESRGALISMDAGSARDVMLEGESGILACSPPDFMPNYEPSKRRITWPNGSSATIFTSVSPEDLRGPQYHWGWCFVAGTKVQTPSGAVNIEDLLPGHVVMTSSGPQPVLRCLASEEKEVHRLLLSNGVELVGTPDHPIFTNCGWKPLCEVTPDDIMLSYDEWGPTNTVQLRAVTRSVNTGLKQRVYNLTVDGSHDYFANGVLVHNCDEMASWENVQMTWDMFMFGLRLGRNPQCVVTTTPKPIPLVRKLVDEATLNPGGRVVITRGTTYDNRANLASSFFKEIITQYEGTALGRQELNAEIIDPEESGIIKRSWIQLWPHETPLPRFQTIVQSYDTAFTEKTENDPTACTVWGIFEEPKNPGVYSAMLLDAWSEHLPYPQLREKVKTEWGSQYGEHENKADVVLIEEKGSGISLIQDLRMAKVPVRPYNPGRSDKMQRLHTVSHLFYNKRVYVPESSKEGGKPVKWAGEMISQLCAFPLVEHDDYVDSTTQALQLLRDQYWLVVDPDDTPDEVDYHANKKKANPYE